VSEQALKWSGESEERSRSGLVLLDKKTCQNGLRFRIADYLWLLSGWEDWAGGAPERAGEAQSEWSGLALGPPV
jgi:hypothetical protein